VIRSQCWKLYSERGFPILVPASTTEMSEGQPGAMKITCGDKHRLWEFI